MYIQTPPTLYLRVTTEKNPISQSFDHHKGQEYNNVFHTITGTTFLFKNWEKNDTVLVTHDQYQKGDFPKFNYDYLAVVRKREGKGKNEQGYELNFPENLHDFQQFNKHTIDKIPYFVVSNDEELGDYVKLYNRNFKIIQIQAEGVEKYVEQSTEKEDFLAESLGTFEACETLNLPCRICLSEDSDQDDFLMSPCHCKGHTGAVHLMCLKQWIYSNREYQTYKNTIVYRFKKINCQICKFSFPGVIQRGKKRIPLLTMERPIFPYVGFEYMEQTSKEPVKKFIFINLTNDQGITYLNQKLFGYCGFLLVDGRLYLKDYGARYGTLVKTGKEISLKERVMLQISRTIYQFSYH